MIEHAIKYRVAHNLSVFPIRPGSKRPLDKWEPYQSRLASYREIRSWDAHCNLAMATGALSGVVIVDCESQADADWFLENKGQTPLRTQTPRGVHLWFGHPGRPVPNATKVTDSSGQPRYDIRGDGGYVLMPPSRVEADGKDVKVSGEYRFSGCDLSALSKIPVFQVEWRPKTNRYREDEKRIRDGPKYIGKIRAVSGQRGHDETFRAVCRLKEAELSETEALAAMVEWNETNADPPWSIEELLHKVNSVYGKKER